jgi:hypothetical protein
MLRERARDDFVIARPSELHSRYGPSQTTGSGRGRPEPWRIDMAPAYEWLAERLAWSARVTSLVPRAVGDALLAIQDSWKRAVHAIAIAAVAISIALALLWLAGSWLR